MALPTNPTLFKSVFSLQVDPSSPPQWVSQDYETPYANSTLNETESTQFAPCANSSYPCSNQTLPPHDESQATVEENNDAFNDYTKWVMKNYDVNQDGFLDGNETKRLLDDAMKADVKLDDVSVWLNRFDANKDGRLSI